MARKPAKKSARASPFKRNVVPDRLDLRDRTYMPSVVVIPGPVLEPNNDIPVLNQRDTNACTGFALTSVVYHLMRAARRKPAECFVSPFMLYSMARRYDEFPGDPKADEGSSVRGAMKGWYKHGACARRLWPAQKMPTPKPLATTAGDWWLDAVRRPLGSYYRVDARSVTDMHVALMEVGILYASAICHGGWDEGSSASARKGWWQIPPRKATYADGGHAFAIVGYNSKGFIVHNSWGPTWGTGGCAVLTYEDWLEHAMDCWVAQLGVVTDLHLEIAKSPSLRVRSGTVRLAAETSLRNRELSPFVIDMENNGRLSNTGEFRTQDSDVDALVSQHLEAARETWGLGNNDPVDIAIYAHGGLVSEDGAARTAAKWVPALYNNQIFPIFLMWETDLFSTLQNRLEDELKGEPRPAGGLIDSVKSWWNERLEELLAYPGSLIWGEMKQNADAISIAADSGCIKLYQAFKKSPLYDPRKVRLHLIGHSAGAIVQTYMIPRLIERRWTFQSVNFMAPAVRMDLFQENVMPAIESGAIKQFNQFHLADEIERKDPTCKAILGYGRSLLYLVSRSFEKGKVTPILGMQKYFEQIIDPKKLPNVAGWIAPGDRSRSTTHGGFDDDATTMASVIGMIKNATL